MNAFKAGNVRRVQKDARTVTYSGTAEYPELKPVLVTRCGVADPVAAHPDNVVECQYGRYGHSRGSRYGAVTGACQRNVVVSFYRYVGQDEGFAYFTVGSLGDRKRSLVAGYGRRQCEGARNRSSGCGYVQVQPAVAPFADNVGWDADEGYVRGYGKRPHGYDS